MKNFNYYKPKALIITILVIYALILIFYDYIEHDYVIDYTLILNLLGKISIATTTIIILFYIFHKWLWKIPTINKLIHFPNLHGSYYGKLISTYKDKEGYLVEKECVIEIEQNGTDITIHGYYATDEEYEASSVSRSESYSLSMIDESHAEIVYQYYNTPNKPRDKFGSLNPHHGTSTILWNKHNPEHLTIQYYNNERNSKGSISLKKQSSRLEGKFYRP